MSFLKSRTATPVPPAPPPSVPELLTPPPAFNNLRLPKALPGQEENLIALGKHFDDAALELPVKEGGDGAEKRGLSEREKMFLSRETFTRYLTSTRGDVSSAIARLERTLIWRRTEQIDEVEMLAAKYKEANKTGKGMVLGFSPRGEPVVYSFTHRNLTPAASRRGVDTTFMIERASDLMVDGVTEAIVIFYYGGERMGEPSNLSTSREMLSIMSDHYPYKLSLCAFQSLPWVVRTAMNVAWPFADAALKENVKFDKNLVKDGDVDRAVLMKPLGGDLDFTYDHDTYWDTLINTCLERRQDQLEKWRALGEPRTGREERLFKVRPTGHQ